MKTRIVIVVEGGEVTDVLMNNEVEYQVLDFDQLDADGLDNDAAHADACEWIRTGILVNRGITKG